MFDSELSYQPAYHFLLNPLQNRPDSLHRKKRRLKKSKGN